MKRIIPIILMAIFLLGCDPAEDIQDYALDQSWMADIIYARPPSTVRDVYNYQWNSWRSRDDMEEFLKVTVSADLLRSISDEVWDVYIEYYDESPLIWEESESTAKLGSGSCVDEAILRYMAMARMGLEDYVKIVSYMTSKGGHAECAVNFDGFWMIRVNGIWVDKPAGFIIEFTRRQRWFN